jgi:hypothetical protein
MGNEENFGQFKMQTFDFAQFMKLDAAAARALNVLPQPGAAKNMSVNGLLDKCKTNQVARQNDKGKKKKAMLVSSASSSSGFSAGLYRYP